MKFVSPISEHIRGENGELKAGGYVRKMWCLNGVFAQRPHYVTCKCAEYLEVGTHSRETQTDVA